MMMMMMYCFEIKRLVKIAVVRERVVRVHAML